MSRSSTPGRSPGLHAGPSSPDSARTPARGRRPWRRLRGAVLLTVLLVLGAVGTAGLASAETRPSPAVSSPRTGTESAGARDASLYVADYAGNDVLKRRLPRGPQTTVPTTDLTRPTYLALDRSRALYVSDTGDNRIVKVSADGRQTTVPTQGLLHPEGLALDARAQRLYVSDSGNDRVVRVPVGAGGGAQRTVRTDGLSSPSGLALDEARERLYVADFGNDRVVRVPVRGGRQTTVPFTGLTTPVGVVLRPGGHERHDVRPGAGKPEHPVRGR